MRGWQAAGDPDHRARGGAGAGTASEAASALASPGRHGPFPTPSSYWPVLRGVPARHTHRCNRTERRAHIDTGASVSVIVTQPGKLLQRAIPSSRTARQRQQA